MAQISTGIPPPNTEISTAASATPGKAMTMSSVRISASSTAFREVAATAPITAPAASASSVAPSPMASDQRAPCMRRLRMSRPRLSWPIQCSPEGPSAAPAWAYGSCGASSGANSAARTTTARTASATLDSTGRRVNHFMLRSSAVG